MDILTHKIVLASQSPRRKSLMEQAGFVIEIFSLDVEEIYPCSLDPYDVPVFLSELKASAAIAKRKAPVILCADTIVIFENEVLGKPKNLSDAKEMLRKMQGKSHDVVTGVTISLGDVLHSFSCLTKVLLKTMSDAELDYYVNNYPVLDKAGAYGIQDWIGWAKIDRIEGSYSNVMGLPMAMVYEKLKELTSSSKIKGHQTNIPPNSACLR